MKIVKILCDRCGCEIEGNPYRFYISEIDRESEAVFSGKNICRDFCRSCISIISQDIMDAMVLEDTAQDPVPAHANETEPNTESNAEICVGSVGISVEPEQEEEHNPEPEPVKEKKPEPKKTALKQEEKKKPRKTWINKLEEKEIATRYRNGDEPEEIADQMNLLRAQVSRFIYDSGLGKERYKGKKIPSNGGAPIPMCSVESSIFEKEREGHEEE